MRMWGHRDPEPAETIIACVCVVFATDEIWLSLNRIW
jgi:hypothetical protein